MKPRLFVGRGSSALSAFALVSLLACFPGALRAANPTPITGKIYVAGSEGGSQVATSEKVEALKTKSIFVAQGSQIETKPQATLTMVFSNGTGVFLYPDTHIDIRRFTQEPFVASRTDLEVEPSISHTVVFLSRGALAGPVPHPLAVLPGSRHEGFPCARGGAAWIRARSVCRRVEDPGGLR